MEHQRVNDVGKEKIKQDMNFRCVIPPSRSFFVIALWLYSNSEFWRLIVASTEFCISPCFWVIFCKMNRHFPVSKELMNEWMIHALSAIERILMIFLFFKQMIWSNCCSATGAHKSSKSNRFGFIFHD